MNEPIKDKAPKPPGLLPKNVQSWVIIGIALLMVVIMWLTGGKKPQATGKSAAPTVLTPAPVEVNETKIADLQSRIQDLQKQQLAAQNALAQQTRLLGSLPQEQSQAQPNAGPSSVPPATAEDAIKAERRKREYLSLFASNLALSYRKNTSSAGTSPHGEYTGRTTPGGDTEFRRIPIGATPQRDAASCIDTATLNRSIRGNEFRTNTDHIGPGNRANPRTKGGRSPCRRGLRFSERGGREDLHPLRRHRT